MDDFICDNCNSWDDDLQEGVCASCNYPDWWADNDCADCGGMSYENALDSISSN